MSRHEVNIIATLISTALVFAIYWVKMHQMYQAGMFNTADTASLVGKAILLLIVVQIGVNIVTRIASHILFYVSRREDEPDMEDERDKLIELRGLRISFFVLSGGFILSMIALAVGQPTFLVFNLIIFSFTVGDMAGNGLKLHHYRRGF